MIYTFGEDQDGVKISVDTEDPEIKRRVAWVADMAGLALPKLGEYLNVFPGATIDGNLDPHKLIGLAWGQYEFEKDGRRVPVDVRIFADGAGLLNRLQGALAWLSVELGLGLSAEAIQNMIYQAPTAAETKADWDVPGAVVGPPMPQPGWFESRKLGHREGDTWRGASGASYRLEYMPGFAFFRPLAWRKL